MHTPSAERYRGVPEHDQQNPMLLGDSSELAALVNAMVPFEKLEAVARETVVRNDLSYCPSKHPRIHGRPGR